METLQEVAHAKTWCGQVQLARWGQIIFKVASKKSKKKTFDFNIYFINQNFRKYLVKYYIFWYLGIFFCDSDVTVYFKWKAWCLQFSHITNEKNHLISAPASKMWSNQKNKGSLLC